MNKTFFFICLLGASHLLSAQLADWESSSRNDSASSFLQIRGNYRLDSDHIPGVFLNNLIFGGMIEESEKDVADSHLGPNNHLYLQSTLGASWRSSMNAAGWRYGLAISDERRGYASLPDELFRLIFYGNASDKSKGEEFANAEAIFYQAKQLSFFTEKTIKAEKGIWRISAGADVMQANQMMHLDWPAGQVQTTENTNEVFFASEADLYLSDRSNLPSWGVDGWGFSGNIGLSVENKNCFAEFSIRELGVIRSSGRAVHYSRHAERWYEGVDPAKLFSDFSALNIPSGEDSIFQKLDIIQTSEAFTLKTPALFSIIGGHRKGDFALKYGLRYRLYAWPLPLVFAALAWSPERGHWQYNALVYGGGSGRFDLGIGVEHRLSDQLQWAVGSDHVLGILSNRSFGGFSAYFGLKWNL